MPMPDQYGSQPPLELLRQFLDTHGWYDRRELVFRRIEDVATLACCGPPGPLTLNPPRSRDVGAPTSRCFPSLMMQML